MMTMEQKFYSMTMKTLVVEAEKLGVKIDKKGSKAKAVEKMLAALATATEETTATEQPVAVEEPAVEEPAVTVTEVAEQPKKERKARARRKKTFEELVADIPIYQDVRFVKSSRGDVYVYMGTDSHKLFWYYAQWIIVGNAALVAGLTAEKKSYGYRLAPTRENMLAVLANYRNC